MQGLEENEILYKKGLAFQDEVDYNGKHEMTFSFLFPEASCLVLKNNGLRKSNALPENGAFLA